MTFDRDSRRLAQRVAAPGVFFAIGAYAAWGALPAFFQLLQPASAYEIVAARIVFTLVFCCVIATIFHRWRKITIIMRNPRLFLLIGLAGALIYVAWQVYILGALSGHILEVALGYFINPIITVLLGVFVERERLRFTQWVAVGISVVAVIVLAISYGAAPWISLVIAVSFGLYGLIKKRIGPRVDAVSGLTLETAWLMPVAILQLLVISLTGSLTLGSQGIAHDAALVSTGLVTAIPLLLFAAAARRLPLSTLGFIQYLAPIAQFAFAVFVMHEALTPCRWVGFGLVWLALITLTADAIHANRVSRNGEIASKWGNN